MPGKIGLITLESAAKIGSRVNRILSEWRDGEECSIPAECPRFSSGEGSGRSWTFTGRRDRLVPVRILSRKNKKGGL